MSSRKRYKLWQQNANVAIPRRTLTRLKKKANDFVVNIHAQGDNEHFDQDEHDQSAESLADHDGNFFDTEDSDLEEPAICPSDEECAQTNDFSLINNDLECDEEQFHLPEESYYRDHDDYVCEFDSSDSDSSDSDGEENNYDRVPIYPGALITVEDSILSIMKFAIRHKTTYSALSDLLGLISLHLPREGSKEHLKSLYFLKKAFAASGQKDDMIMKHEYCSACFGPLEKGNITCTFCGKENPTKKRNYFLSLNVSEQMKSMFKETDFLKDLEYGFQTRELSRSRLDSEDREWHDIMDGDLYQEMLRPGAFLTNKHNLSLTFNSDGVHVFKASRDEIWPILLVINEIHPSVRMSTKRMILAGLWFGPSKPAMPTFLASFREQMNQLKRNGISVDWNGQSVVCRAVCLIGTADLPGKCALQGFTQYNGYCGCSFCETEGERIPVQKGNCQVYPYSPGPPKKLRTKDKTVKDGKNAQQRAKPVCGVKMVSQLCLIEGFDIVRGMPVDYMHGVLLGIVKMLFSFWFDNKYKKETYYIGDRISEIDERLVQCQPPDFISRLPRSLVKDRKYWKASEVRSWLLYYSLPVLKGILSDELYCHYALLSTSIYLLLQQPVTTAGLTMADKQLDEFYWRTQQYYGKAACTINVHNAGKHLTSSVVLAGPLWAYSCFGTEGWNGTMMKLIHGTHNVAIQVVAAVRALRLMAIKEKQESESLGTVNYIEQLNGKNRNNFVYLFPGCYSVGCLTKVVLSMSKLALLNKQIPGSAVNVTEAYTFKKMSYKSQIFYSKACTKVKKRNSYTISYLNANGELVFGVILHFLKVVLAHPEESTRCLAAIQELKESSDDLFCDIQKTTRNKELGIHLKPCKYDGDNDMTYIDIIDIEEKVVSTTSFTGPTLYVTSPPNTWEMD